jgi:thioredoxin reductase (NADPH)
MSNTAIGAHPRVRIYGKLGSSLGYMIRDFLQRSDIDFEWIELSGDQEARHKAGVSSLNDSRLPICEFPDGTRLEHPTIRQITEKLGWFRDPSRAEYDLAIYGAGPAGLSAAVYGASEGLATVLIERSAVGGQAASSTRIENYLGFPGGVSGAELAERAREQACRFGAELLIGREGVRGEFLPGKGVGYLADGTKIVARSTICATGVEYHRLNLPGEDRLLGAGVYYGAGASEASLCRATEDVFIVGGNSAGQAALYFSHFARMVYVLRNQAPENRLKLTELRFITRGRSIWRRLNASSCCVSSAALWPAVRLSRKSCSNSVFSRRLLQQHRGIPVDDREQIVKIMSNLPVNRPIASILYACRSSSSSLLRSEMSSTEPS